MILWKFSHLQEKYCICNLLINLSNWILLEASGQLNEFQLINKMKSKFNYNYNKKCWESWLFKKEKEIGGLRAYIYKNYENYEVQEPWNSND